ncbi:hypothetical protein BU26DRAFT_451587, partial [Trematosphaeria pertusa]
MSNLDRTQSLLFAYKQYKRDTEYIAGWLAETSRIADYALKEQGERTQSKPKKRRKDRKKAKRDGGANSGPQYLIKVADFVPMAESIAKAESDVLVPVSNWFKFKIDADTESNKRHHYFITVLEDAFRVLRPFISTGPHPARAGDGKTNPEAMAFENRFATLTIGEAAEMADELEAEDLALPDVVHVLLEKDDEELEEELKLAVSVFLEGLQAMHGVACEQWKKYKSGEVDLIVAAMVTDAAIKLAQRAEAEFDLVVVHRPQKYSASTYPLWKLLEAFAEPPNTQEESHDHDAQKTATFWPTHAGLRLYLNKLSRADPRKSIPSIVARELEDAHAHTVRAAEFAQMIHITFGKRPHVWDLVSKGIMHMLEKREMSAWATLTLQIHLDSQDILGDECARTAYVLNLHAQKMIELYNDVFDYDSPFLPKPKHESERGNFVAWVCGDLPDALEDCITWVVQDGFGEQWRTLLNNPKVASHPVLKTLRSEPKFFLRHHPLLCGMIKYDIYRKCHAAGLRYEAQTDGVNMLAHIYVTGGLEATIRNGSEGRDEECFWPDMEFVLQAQDPEWLFVGGFPKSLEEAQRKFLLAAGSPATNQARDIPLKRLKVNLKNIRQFRDYSVFGEGVNRPADAGTRSADDMITRLLQMTKAGWPWGRIAKQLMGSEQAQGPTTSPIGDQKNVTPPELLGNLGLWLQADTPDLFFDWLRMQLVCGDIWKEIFSRVERYPHWDREASQLEKPVIEPDIDILTRDKAYPTFLQEAFGAVKARIDSRVGVLGGDTCLSALAMYHKRTARQLDRVPGPLSIANLYRYWPEEKWRPYWERMKSEPEEE